MKHNTKSKLFAAWAWCDLNDKSTEFMLQFMCDEANIEYDRAVAFVVDTTTQQRVDWYSLHPNWLEDWKKMHIL